MLLLRIFYAVILLMVLDCQWSRFPLRLIRKLIITKMIITVRSMIDEWCVYNGYFREIDSRWDPLTGTVDNFASYVNTKLPRFYSSFCSPNTLGV